MSVSTIPKPFNEAEFIKKGSSESTFIDVNSLRLGYENGYLIADCLFADNTVRRVAWDLNAMIYQVFDSNGQMVSSITWWKTS